MHVALISPKYAAPIRNPDSDELSLRNGPDKNSFGRGGLGLHVGRLSKALVQAGCRVTVLAYSPGADGITEESGATVCRLSLAESHSQVDPDNRDSLNRIYDRCTTRLNEFFGDNEAIPDIVHCHHHTVFPVAAEIRRRCSTPIVTTFHYLLSDKASIDQSSVTDATRRGEATLCGGSDLIIAVSNWLKKALLRTFEVPDESIQVIHHGTELPSVDENESSAQQWRNKLAPGGERIVTFVGRLSPEKGLQFHLEAARIVLDHCESVSYAIAGGTPDEVSLVYEQINNTPKLRGKVHLLGWLDGNQLAGLRQASYLAVVPSLYESFGYSAVEAMAASVPVIASSAGGLPEIVEDNECGYLVELQSKEGGRTELNPLELAERQLRLLRDARLHDKFALTARLRANGLFSVHNMVESTIRAYRKVLA